MTSGGWRMDNTTRRADRAGIAIAAFLLIIAGVIFWDTTTLQITSVYGVGPKAMPMVVAAGLVLLAIGNLVMALRGEFPQRESADPKAILLILGGLAALIALIGLGGGFILATAILFAATAAAFGSRAFLTDLSIGFGLGFLTFLIFDKLLTLSLPAGPLERLL
ncbi:MAG: putative tricarboxylic transport rane protein [Alphaproteobacteria bacterium]|nr:putative tricarboxylic transport rane protein [Alphaproteobacteria bacterium]